MTIFIPLNQFITPQHEKYQVRMRKMLPFLTAILFPFLQCINAQAQDSLETNSTSYYDQLDIEWHELAKDLDNYDGFKKYCGHLDYRQRVLKTLNQIHHLDSIFIEKLSDYTYRINEKEREATLREIRKFEEKYKAKSFIATLNKECKEYHEIERAKKETKSDFANNSYNGQKHILEVVLSKFVHHITKLLNHITKHIHHLNLK